MPNPYIHAIAHTTQGGDPLQIDVSQVNGAVATDDPRLEGGGSGDMLKSIYDTDNDGVVDNAEALLGFVPPASGNANATQIVLGNDTRLADSRNPLAHAPLHNLGGNDPVAPDWIQIVNKPTLPSPVGDMTKAVYDTNASGIVDNAEALLGHVTPASGNAATAQVVLGSDTRLADNRTPLPHETTHLVGGNDPIPLVTTAAAGLCVPPDGTTIQITGGKLVSTGGGGGGDMYKSTYDTNNNGIVDNAEALLGHVTPASGNATATQIVLGSDTRLADNRTPLPHETTHLVGGSDPIPLVTTAAAGLCVPPDGTTIQITGGKLVATASGGIPWVKQWQAGFEGFPSATNYALFSVTNATPYQNFPSAGLNIFNFLGMLPPGLLFPNGMLIRLKWSGPTAGTVTWNVAYERFGLTVVTADAFGTVQAAALVTSVGINLMNETDLTIPLSAMGNPATGVAAGEAFRLQVSRPSASPGTIANANLWLVSIQAA